MQSIRTALLAEDSADDRFFFERALKKARILVQLFMVADGEDAIAYLGGTGRFSERGQYPLPEVLFLDISMPRKNGFEVLQWLQVRPIIHPMVVFMLSSSTLPADQTRALRLGAKAYLVKPPLPQNFDKIAAAAGLAWEKY